MPRINVSWARFWNETKFSIVNHNKVVLTFSRFPWNGLSLSKLLLFFHFCLSFTTLFKLSGNHLLWYFDFWNLMQFLYSKMQFKTKQRRDFWADMFSSVYMQLDLIWVQQSKLALWEAYLPQLRLHSSFRYICARSSSLYA